MSRKRAPSALGLPEHMDTRAIRASLGGRLYSPITAEALAHDLSVPVQLVQTVLKAMAKAKDARVADTIEEDGERRLRWIEIPKQRKASK